MAYKTTCAEYLLAVGWGWMFGGGRSVADVVAAIAQRCDLAPVDPDVVDRAVQLIHETLVNAPPSSLRIHAHWPRSMYELITQTLDLPHVKSRDIEDWAKVLFIQVTALLQAVILYEGAVGVRNVLDGTSPDSENPAYADNGEG